MTRTPPPESARPSRTTTRAALLVRRAAGPFRALFAPGMWPAGRITGEVLLSVLVALMGLGFESLSGAGPLRMVALPLAAALLSPLRRTLPATVLVLAAVGSAHLAGFVLLLPVAAWSAGRRITGAARAAATFAAVYGLAIGVSLLGEAAVFSLSTLVTAAVLLVIVMVVPGLLGRYLAQRRTLLDTLHEYNAHLLREREMIAGQARLRERQRIAQDMHDSLGHQLALISVHTGALEVNGELTGGQREAVGVLREASMAAMRELREVVGLLKDGTRDTDEAEEQGPAGRGLEGIEALAEASREAGASVEVRRTGEPRPPAPAAGHAAYRVVQEGLTNAHKHAPGAPLTVTLHHDTDSLVVEVVNGPRPDCAGPLPPPVSGGQGLAGLGERARLAGGMVHAGPTADGGFRLAGVLPYVSAAEHGRQPRPATFVEGDSDLRQQIRRGPGGDSAPVLERNGLPKELVTAMGRNKRRTGWAIGCGAVALVVLAGLVVGGVLLFREASKGVIDQGEYDAIKVGESEAKVRDRLPDGDSILTQGLDRGAPPEPAGSTCLSLLALDDAEDAASNIVYRFCFKDSELIEKKTFEVKA